MTGTAFAALLDGLPPAGRDRIRGRIQRGMARAGWQLDAGTLTLSGTLTAPAATGPADRHSYGRKLIVQVPVSFGRSTWVNWPRAPS